ncbi:MAG: HAD-IG family 5'-nucleotidase [Candidatus Eisenbacteria bacterium]|uniref:HAD-IG family 5'-nucleotidase n=1 Tax=Eiseniibacteriota bacterium TaxID=2212470 RepID=A0A948W5B0_UNCEI|nr:HAD-IG family 5'-nucleotidase [Candidatus Eisenbacteria bacterium]MBU1948320.1 HAD-IG family 5'-nucleotidase [Candidatus Eisenbacteria bacterium]MBU2693112.1 HAD-IG family 5'-nucleotidase [Candidatus Eisenbacteria bacterium]
METPPLTRGVHCNRTLNIGAIKALGYDMDYTLVDYNAARWERKAYKYLKAKLLARGWPVESLEFNPSLVIRGLVIDKELGNALKVNRFGYVKKAFHGTRPLDFHEQRRAYSRIIVDLTEKRYAMMTTMFSLSECCMYLQMVDLLDAENLSERIDYLDLYSIVRSDLDSTHLEGLLKEEVLQHPERFVDLDADTIQTLLDQKRAGKRLLLITNSDWPYTRDIMNYTFNRLLPKGTTWRDLFELTIVSAQKPAFFSRHHPLFEVVSEEGLLSPCIGPPTRPGIYLGGHADLVEEYLSLSGDEILFIGDHIYSDIHISKDIQRWRTALILRDLESDIEAVEAFRAQQTALTDLMKEKEQLEFQWYQARLQQQRSAAEEPQTDSKRGAKNPDRSADEIRNKLSHLDDKIAPLAKAAAQLNNENWGLLMRAGNDKSLLAHQMEMHADIYTSRVSNFLFQTPFAFLRSNPGHLPHEV